MLVNFHGVAFFKALFFCNVVILIISIVLFCNSPSLVSATPTASRSRKMRRGEEDQRSKQSPSRSRAEEQLYRSNNNDKQQQNNDNEEVVQRPKKNKSSSSSSREKTVVTSTQEDEVAASASSSSPSQKKQKLEEQEQEQVKQEAPVKKEKYSSKTPVPDPENLPHDDPLMMPSTHPDAAFQADHVPKTERLHVDDKSQAMSDIVESQREKREQEKTRHPAASQQFIELHGQRVSVASLQQMCNNLKSDHLPFLRKVSTKELELSTLFAANRLSSVFDGHMTEKRLAHVDNISCPHGIQIAKSPDADKLYNLMQEIVREQEGIRLHLLDLADAWTITQSKDSDLVEEVVASLGYYKSLERIGNTLTQKLAFLRSPGAVMAKNCVDYVRDLSKLVRQVPEGVPNWTHMRVGAEMLIHQCSLEPSLSGDL